MKRTIKKNYAYIFTFLLVSASIVYFSKRSVIKTRFFVCEIDPVLSDATKKEIQQFVQPLGQVCAQNVCNQLQEQFLCIKSTSYQLLADNSVQLNIIAYDPCCIVNQSHVLLDNDCIVSKDFFAEVITQNLSCVYMDSEEIANYEQTKLLSAFLQKITPEIIENYSIEWRDECMISLTDKQQKKFVIVCQADQAPDASMCIQCDQVKHELNEKGVFSHRTKTNWIADVRFENQIIVRADKGGTGNGSRIS